MQNVNPLHQWKLRLPIVLDLVLPVKHPFSNPCQRQTQLQLPFQQLEKGQYFFTEMNEMRDYRALVSGFDQADRLTEL